MSPVLKDANFATILRVALLVMKIGITIITFVSRVVQTEIFLMDPRAQAVQEDADCAVIQKLAKNASQITMNQQEHAIH